MHPSHDDQLVRLNKIDGQVKGIKKMIEGRRYCVDIMTQIKAVTSALYRVEQEILKTHMRNCLKSAVESKQPDDVSEKIEEIMGLLSKRI
ncbi:MAG: metal-sensitive transcriptional regulator [Pseudomonadales bacterium]|jgi:DNA-binding FrmR family transcriptional regulator|nr:metal-sensitive transcriptional regulator [Pseudomonadales bacterium]MDP7360314.1 metal-sensitive transcriptional regulator [Pseudomonadales bacterium]MDP7597574.1 metal-sensitive transcriptional regulator [Pseudomonadales bacterium]HJN50788.1 metal-sensitive transcriptional regulator [Pseudomonadales bacterium]|tara:strand:+ start:2347 stop:2616 length:270 start_codon:yes stop_codon:yes gene_type:complete